LQSSFVTSFSVAGQSRLIEGEGLHNNGAIPPTWQWLAKLSRFEVSHLIGHVASQNIRRLKSSQEQFRPGVSSHSTPNLL
jgi:hypothetical protein